MARTLRNRIKRKNQRQKRKLLKQARLSQSDAQVKVKVKPKRHPIYSTAEKAEELYAGILHATYRHVQSYRAYQVTIAGELSLADNRLPVTKRSAFATALLQKHVQAVCYLLMYSSNAFIITNTTRYFMTFLYL